MDIAERKITRIVHVEEKKELLFLPGEGIGMAKIKLNCMIWYSSDCTQAKLTEILCVDKVMIQNRKMKTFSYA